MNIYAWRQQPLLFVQKYVRLCMIRCAEEAAMFMLGLATPVNWAYTIANTATVRSTRKQIFIAWDHESIKTWRFICFFISFFLQISFSLIYENVTNRLELPDLIIWTLNIWMSFAKKLPFFLFDMFCFGICFIFMFNH